MGSGVKVHSVELTHWQHMAKLRTHEYRHANTCVLADFQQSCACLRMVVGAHGKFIAANMHSARSCESFEASPRFCSLLSGAFNKPLLGESMEMVQERYQGYVVFMRCNSGFGWDHVTKNFTVSNEVWEEYFKGFSSKTSYDTQKCPKFGKLFKSLAKVSGGWIIKAREDLKTYANSLLS
ncbi:hypothetical protein Syun_031706 [Stephania yunnanensis]|uniref:Myb/SANT-like domain-containing protein n=1 Tax=Stephania yunnanensis TaxID=152371 RepID=A0AAP0DWN1_9MAGN